MQNFFASVQQATKKKQNRVIKTFVQDLLKNSTFKFPEVESVELEWRNILNNHLQTQLVEDKQHCFIHYCKPGAFFNSDLISCALLELEPKPGVIFTTLDFGKQVEGLASLFNSESKEIKRKQKSFIHAADKAMKLSHTTEDTKGAINTILIPMNIDNVHWGCFVACRRQEGIRKRGVLYWGDSLEWKCKDIHRKAMIKMLKFSFPEDKWIFSDRNYMTNCSLFVKQSDGSSCGAYLINLFSLFSDTRGIMPEDSFEIIQNSPTLPDRIRWQSAAVRVKAIIQSGIAYKKNCPDIVDVWTYLYNNRQYRFSLRHQHDTSIPTPGQEYQHRRKPKSNHSDCLTDIISISSMEDSRKRKYTLISDKHKYMNERNVTIKKNKLIAKKSNIKQNKVSKASNLESTTYSKAGSKDNMKEWIRNIQDYINKMPSEKSSEKVFLDIQNISEKLGYKFSRNT